MKLGRVLIASMICIAAFTNISCGTREPEKPRQHNTGKPNVLIITLDTTRKDHLSTYGYKRKTSPRLDSLAKGGAIFDSAYSSATWTVPSHASLFTGLYIKTHGADFKSSYLPEGSSTLAEILLENGYDTAGIVTSPALNPMYNIGQGFNFFCSSYMDNDPDESTDTYINTVAMSWLGRVEDKKPFFLFVNYFDPHSPLRHHKTPVSFTDYPYKGLFNPGYINIGGNFRTEKKTLNFQVMYEKKPIPKPDLEYMEALYDEEIAYMDYSMGQLLDSMKKGGYLDNTIVVILADHGESFSEHFMMDHGRALYADQMNIPMVIWYPAKIKAGGRIAAPVQNVDVMPTILDYVGIDPKQDISGISLRSALDGHGDMNRMVFAESGADASFTGWFGKRFGLDKSAVILGDRKLISYSDGSQELFDVKGDPAEFHNLTGSEPAAAAILKAKMTAFAATLPKAVPKDKPKGAAKAAAKKKELPEETRKQLKSLGYIH